MIPPHNLGLSLLSQPYIPHRVPRLAVAQPKLVVEPFRTARPQCVPINHRQHPRAIGRGMSVVEGDCEEPMWEKEKECVEVVLILADKVAHVEPVLVVCIECFGKPIDGLGRSAEE